MLDERLDRPYKDDRNHPSACYIGPWELKIATGTGKKQPKKSMFYNRKNATYSADPRYFPKQFRGSAAVPADRRKTSMFSPPSRAMHPLLVVLTTFAICGGVFVLLKVISQLLR